MPPEVFPGNVKNLSALDLERSFFPKKKPNQKNKTKKQQETSTRQWTTTQSVESPIISDI